MSDPLYFGDSLPFLLSPETDKVLLRVTFIAHKAKSVAKHSSCIRPATGLPLCSKWSDGPAGCVLCDARASHAAKLR